MLGSDTYWRLVSGLALPQYVLYTLLMASSYIILVLVRWSRTNTATSTDPQPTPRVLTRSDSKATMYHNSAAEARTAEEACTGHSYLDSLASRPDLCYHVAQSVALGVLAASTLRMKCFWCPYICVLSSVALADTSLWSALVSRVKHNKCIECVIFQFSLFSPGIRRSEQSHCQPCETPSSGLSHHSAVQ